MASKTRRLATIDEAKSYLNLKSSITIRRRIADGTFAGYRVPGTRAIRVDLNEIDDALQRIPAGVAPGMVNGGAA